MIKTILIVDDEPSILETLSEVFRKLGWMVYTAGNAKKALLEFKKNTPTLVLTDLRLKDSVGGVGICREVKNIAPLTMVIAMTGFGSETYTVANLRRKGFDHIMRKPVALSELEIMVLIVARCRETWNSLEKLSRGHS